MISPWQWGLAEFGVAGVTINTGSIQLQDQVTFAMTSIFPSGINLSAGGAISIGSPAPAVIINENGIQLPAGATITVGGVQVYP